ncbi:MAG: DUF615 domain-containing protein [Zoogloeaceae bacterium]|jgi:ribosome-associated protein|nr:DUF615 domain-containing protein [Zoogloeaceae bacterium]
MRKNSFTNKIRDDAEEEARERPSKTRVKAETHALEALGEDLTRLTREQITRAPLPDALREAVLEYGRIRKLSARRRQLRYIGRLLREEGDAAAIRAVLADLSGESATEIARLHRIETLRQRLLEDEAGALAEIAANCPDADVTRLRQLRRAALKDAAEQKPPRNFRALFHALKTLGL